MKFPTPCLLRIPVALLSLLWMAAPFALADGSETKAGVVAEVWPFEKPAATAAPRVFDTWRSQAPPAGGSTLPLEKLAVPARETASMVRVRGMLVPPQTGGYTIDIHGSDDAELLLLDDVTGEWRLIQRNGNPNTGAGRVKLVQGVARRFEFRTMGRGNSEVHWELATRDALGLRTVLVAKQAIPASNMAAPASAVADRQAPGPRDEWQRKWGIDLDCGDGPSGPFGDPDGDGIPNWLEYLTNGDPLKADGENREGLVRFEVWRNVPGQYVFDLTRSANFPQHPDEVHYLTRLEIPVGNGNDYGSRVRGLIKPPASGEYTFNIIANDTAELWLSDSESWQGKRLIARADQHSGQARWTRGADQGGKPLFPEQIATVTLKQGQRYYVEILHKQMSKEDFCMVGWVVPGGSTPEVIGSEFLVSWQHDPADTADAGLPDAWLQASGLMAEGVDPASRNAYADPDGDGLTNWDEFIGKTDPLKPDAVETTHMLTCEVWTDLPGSRIHDLVLDKRFPAKPTHATLVDNIDFSAEGDSYGVRLRGYLTAPDDGPYVFYISGSDACVLYLAESEDKFTKHAIAQTSAGTGWRAYGQSHSQESEPVELKQGQKYYVEVLFKRGARQDAPANGIDNASVAWRRPGRQGLGQTVINAAYFSPYRPDPRDANDNDLLDSWELAFGLDPKDTSGANGAWSDSDGDWLDNFTEFQLHLDPKVADYQPLPGALLSEMPENFLQLQLPLDPKADFTCLPGFALWESWENIPGDSLAALIASPTFPLAPTQRKWVSSIEGPCGMGKSYGSRLRAWIVPPATGSYTFAISGDNECGLWLSPTDRKYDRQRIACVTDHSDYRKWDEQASQVSLPVKLEAGKRYFMEVLHKQGDGADHVSVAWKIPGSAVFRIIRDTALAGYARDPTDLNDDDIPDAWQKAYKIVGSGYQDSDGDGLSNREEYLLGTRPDLVDSDGDGVSDFDEVTFYHSDPNVRDAQPPVVETEIAPDSFTASDTRWFSSGGMLVSFDRRGTTSWNFPLDRPGVYQVVMKARVLSSLSYSISVPVTLEVDGTPVGSGSVQPGDLATTIRFFTQYLKPGAHLVTLDNRNVRNGISLGVESLEILRHEGADADGNGIPDWLQHIYDSVDTLDSPTDSPVSPACIEGAARFIGDLSLTADGEPLLARQALAGRWYADLPLRADQPVKLDVSFEGGAVRRELEFRWVPLNLLTCGPSLALRVGDSILCTAYVGEDAGDAQFGLSFDGEEIHAGPAASPFPLTFPKPGTFTLAVETAGGRSEVQVLVVAASFGPDLNVAVGRARTWPLPQVGPDLALECDPGIIIEDTGAQSASSGRCLSVSVRGEESGDFNILARLSAGGPIVASSTVHGFLLAPATVTGDSRVVQTLPDGTVVIRVGYVIDGRVPADLSVWLQIFVTNAVFANGDTWYHLTAADFDANGQASLLIYKAPVDGQANMPHYICHRVNAYADAPPGAQVPVAPAAAAPPAPAVPPSDAAPKAP